MSAVAPGMIEAKGLVMRYPTGRLALDGATLTVAAGELVVVLGHNGSGKSTMLRCIAGLLRPTAGLVRVAGQELTRLSGRKLAEARMALGMIFQHGHLVRRRSVLANVLCGTLGRHRSVATSLGALPWSEAAFAAQCLDAVGLLRFARQRADTLSGGQAQRVAIARALAQRPHAVLADEPVASLDPEAAEEIMRLLRGLASRDGLPVVCVLHQPELARRYADRILGLRQGRMVFLEDAASITPGQVSALYEGQAA
ncbi:MAG TPA: phosphonate ABC transporter ATP-binding protein [Acetobacteraceae bacterium]|nr:phosphonate ABC transporter ATP-binding protein [Acetobacteraceae bacterium]